jgi:hypothetical protein
MNDHISPLRMIWEILERSLILYSQRLSANFHKLYCEK